MTQMTFLNTTAPVAIAVGTPVLVRSSGLSGLVVRVDTESYAETMLVVDFYDGGRSAILKPSEVMSKAHPLDWTCRCEVCITARKMLGRAFRGGAD